MQTIESLRRQIDSVKGLESVVRTMKSLAAVSIRQYEQAVASLEEYNHTIELGLQVVLRNQMPTVRQQPPVDAPTGVIIFGSDQGLVGQFNERITSFALRRLERMKLARAQWSVLAVGARVVSHLEGARVPVDAQFDVPGSINGIALLVQDIVLQVEAWRQTRGIERVLVFYNRTLRAASYEPHLLRLLPIDVDWLQRLNDEPWPSRVLPTSTMDWDALFTALLQQYLFVGLYRACAESLAGENASRLAAMQAAERNIEERLIELHNRYHYQRQSAITEELLDIVAGFEALS
jgi:F-type H+-transporting ATPase subunit gamma